MSLRVEDLSSCYSHEHGGDKPRSRLVVLLDNEAVLGEDYEGEGDGYRAGDVEQSFVEAVEFSVRVVLERGVHVFRKTLISLFVLLNFLFVNKVLIRIFYKNILIIKLWHERVESK